MELLNVITVTGHTSNRLGGGPEALILVGCLAYVMGAVTYGRKKVSWPSNGIGGVPTLRQKIKRSTPLNIIKN
jgi:hypothetical protein